MTISLVVWAGSWAGIAMGKNPAEADVIWPANGLLLGLVLMAPHRRWPSYFGCAALVSLGIHTCYGFPYGESVIFMLANTAEVLSAALILRHQDRRPDLTRPRTLTAFILTAVLLAPLLSAAVIGIGEHIARIPFGFVGLRDWYRGDALGLGIITPCVLALRQREVLDWLRPGKRLEAVGLFAALLLLTVVIFYRTSYPSAIVLTPLLLLILFRLDASGGAFALLLLTGPAAYLTVRHNSLLAAQGSNNTMIHGISTLQISLAVLVLEVYVVGATLSEMKRVQLALAGVYQQTEQLTGIDLLTFLPNRRTFEAQLYKQRELSVRRQTCLSVLRIEIDDFRAYTGKFGSLTGEAMLKSVSTSLLGSLDSSTSLTARFGGEEFAVMLPNTDAAAAYQVAERLRNAVHAVRQRDENGDLPSITISVGVATAWPRPYEDPAQLLSGAERALEMAKTSGRNKVCVWIEDEPR